MKALGILCGVGSLLRAAEDEGCEVVGNFDPRTTFKTQPEIWRANFDAPYESNLDLCTESNYPEWVDVDIALGHPPCGKHSTMGHASFAIELNAKEKAKRREKRASNVGLLPHFCQGVRNFYPKIWALDNLPKILDRVATPSWWNDQLGREYNISFEVIVNWDYGCVQNRKRLWVIGTRKDLPKFRFKPIKKRPKGAPKNVLECLDGLPWEPWIDDHEICHSHHPPDAETFGSYWTTSKRRTRVQPVSKLAFGFLELPQNHMWVYRNAHGRLIRKPGRMRVNPLGSSYVVTGRESLHHPLTGWGLTIRERARIMGWPDDFVIATDPISRTKRYKLIEATGRAVPSEFTSYLVRQLMDQVLT